MIRPEKINLANLPTPLEKLKFRGNDILIKRDDMTGVELSGNKVRKLEYLIQYAKKENADYIFTAGGDQSNHCRATVIAASKAGIKTKLFLWGKDSKNAEGNLFFDKFFGANISFLTKKENKRVNEIMQKEKQKLEKKNKKVFVIPEGGSTPLGIWGYVSFIEELKNQINLNELEGICLAAGSGGTAAGLLVGLAMQNINLKIYAVTVIYSESEISDKIVSLAKNCIKDFDLNCSLNEENLIVIDGYSEEGYKKITKNKLKLIRNFARETGILLDPAYTGKAFKAYYDKFSSAGSKVLFLHTGGLFGVFGKKEKYLDLVR